MTTEVKSPDRISIKPVVTAEAAPAADNVSEADLAAMFNRVAREKAGAASPPASTVSTPAPATPPQSEPEPTPTTEQPPAEEQDSPASPEPPTADTEEAPEETAETTTEAPPDAKFEYPRFQQRVDSLTAKNKALEATLAEVQAKLAATTPPAPAQPATQPPPPAVEGFSDATLQHITQKLTDAKEMVEFAASHPDGYERDGENPLTLSPEQIRQISARALNDVAALTAKREMRVNLLQTERSARISRDMEAASKVYPWIKNPASPEYQQAMRIVQTHPSLQSDPDAVWLVAGMVAGKAGRPNGQPAKPAAKPTPVTPRPATAAPAPSIGTSRAIKEAQEKWEKSGDARDLSKLLNLRKQAGNTGR
jgi:hypothetical protein